LSKSHEIILASISDHRISEEYVNALKPFCKKIMVHQLGRGELLFNLTKGIFSHTPFQVRYFYSVEFQRMIDEITTQYKPTHIYCQLIRMAEYVRDESSCVKTLDYMDAFSKGYERMSAKMSWKRRWLTKIEWRRLLRYEHEIFADFDKHVIISDQDKQLIHHPESEKIFVSPNGVDLDYYRPLTVGKKYDLIFSGNMSYEPNIESVLFFVKEVLPLIKIHKPDVKLLIAGSDPSAEVRALQNENVIISGWVDDMRKCYAESKVCVAPMLISIGMQNKIIQAMAMKIPCVVTTLANNAIGAIPGKSVLIGERAQDFSSQVMNLLRDDALATSIAEDAYSFVKSRFNWSEITENLGKFLEA
jgi:glycosyltransferase involved in cell wall biosynthesis